MKHDSAEKVYRLTEFTPDPVVLRLLSEQAAREFMAVPLRLERGALVVATAGAMDHASLNQLSRAARRKVTPLKATYPDVRTALNQAYGQTRPQPHEDVAAQFCLRLGYIQKESLPLVEEKSAKTGLSFLDCCASLGLIQPTDLAEAKAILNHMPYLREKNLGKLEDLAEFVPWELAQKYKIIPLYWIGSHLLIASPEPPAPGALHEITGRVHLPIQFVLLPADTWEKLYRRFYLRGSIEEDAQAETVEQLAREQKITAADLQSVRDVHTQTQKSFEDAVLGAGLVERRDWYQALARYYQIPFVETRRIETAELPHLEQWRDLIAPPLARALDILPLQLTDDEWIVGMARPTHIRIRTVEQLTGRPVQARLVEQSAIDAYFEREVPPEETAQDLGLPSIREYAVRTEMVTPLLLEGINDQKLDLSVDSDILVTSGLLDDVTFTELQGLHCNLPFARLEHVQFSDGQLQDIPRELMIRFGCLPLFSSEQQLWVVTADALNGDAFKEIERQTGKYVWPVLAPGEIVSSILERYVSPRQKAVRKEEVQLIEKLVASGYLTQTEATQVLQAHHVLGKPLDLAIAEASTYKPDEVTREIAHLLGIQALSLTLQERESMFINPLGGRETRRVVTDPVDDNTAHLISLTIAEKWCALPVAQRRGEVVVAFADPDYQTGLSELQKIISQPLSAVLSPRAELLDAIQRTLGRRNLGTYLLQDGLISRSQLNRALDLAHRTGVRLGRALVNLRYVTQSQLYQFIARQSGLDFVDLAGLEIDEQLARKIPANLARQQGVLAIHQELGTVTLATTDPLDDAALKRAGDILGQPLRIVVVTDTDLDQALEGIYSREYLDQSISELLERTPEDSAYRVLSRGQIISLIAFLVASAVWLYFGYKSYFIVFNSLATIFYLAFSIYKLILVYRAMDQNLEVPVSKTELAELKDSELPVYSILIPVYHEKELLPDLLDAVARFDYPSTKLDIQVIMEDDDTETIQCFKDWNPPAYFHGVIVPSALPKTKPKACNYGLIHARGDYVVIYDAEDLPEPDQLKKVLVAFGKAKPEVVCIQSKLNYYNRDQNLLTRWFTIEYSMWFDLFLPGLNGSRAPIPLGGTSNHFKRDALLDIGAWDPYNVTEDADLGVRLYKRGYQTAIVDSTTYEEANSKLGNWIRQRSRWIKGYIQTWLVHMRHPVRLWNEIGWKAFLGFQFVVGGNFFTALLNPIYWIFTTVWFLVKWPFIQQIFPAPIFYLGAFCLFIGNFAFTYINVAGAMRRNYYGMVKYALLSPLYWALASIAGWRGFLQLFSNPYFWEKTAHGLNDKPPVPPVNHGETPAASE
jgi:glycosyltransferase XagB